MKIAISLLSGLRYGTATYFNNFISDLADVDKVNEYHFFVQESHPLVDSIKQDNFFVHKCVKSNKSALVRFLWEQLLLPGELRKRKIDVMFTGKNANILLAQCKTVISIRNMEPFFYTRFNNHWILNVFSCMRKLLTRVSMKKANKIIALSEFTMNYIAEYYPELRSKLCVIYNGIQISNDKSAALDNCGSNHKYLLTSSKYVAYANQLNLIEGYALLSQTTENLPSLWLAGGVHDKKYFKRVTALITEKGLAEKVKIFGLVSYERMMELYAGASAFLFPSTLESCPQTLIEAMSFGLPIAASNLPPMTEICQGAAVYFDPYDIKDIADKIRLLLSCSDLREDLSRACLKRVRLFERRDIAAKTVQLLEQTNLS